MDLPFSGSPRNKFLDIFSTINKENAPFFSKKKNWSLNEIKNKNNIGRVLSDSKVQSFAPNSV